MADSQPSISIAAKVREVGFHSVIYGLGSVAQSAVQFLLIPILTATLVPADFGAYSLIQMASVVAGSVFYLGMTSAIPRSYFDYSEEHERRSVFTTAFLLLVAGALAQVAVGVVASRAISRLLLETDRYYRPVFWAFLGSALAFVNQFFFTYLRFRRLSVASIMLSILALVGSLAGALYLLRIDPHDLAAPFQGVTYAQVLVLVLFLGVYGRGALTTELKTTEIFVLLKFGVPTIIGSVGALAIDWADRILIERMLSLRDVGIYSAGYKLGSVVNTLVITPFTQIWNPMMFEYRSHANIHGFFSRIVSYYFLAGSVILAGACIFIREALPIVARSSAYLAAAPVTLLIMGGYLLNGSTNIVSAGLFYERRIFTFVFVYYGVAIGNIALNLYFIPRFGIVGAAATSLVTYAAIPVIIYWQARRYFAIRFEMWRLRRLAVIMSGCLLFGIVIDPRYQLFLLAKLVIFIVVLITLVVFCTDSSERSQIGVLFRRRSHPQDATERT